MFLLNRSLIIQYFFIGLALSPSNSFAFLLPEYISSFHSDIRIAKDASLHVTEQIEVHAEGDKIKHGIYREFPTRYGSAYRHFVSFEIQHVLLNGESVPYHTESLRNGIRLYIGDKKKVLTPGKYVFEIAYITNRQLGMFETHDEVYWNVTGQAWRFPIKHISARIQLPEMIPAQDINAVAYAGYSGSTGDQDVSHQIEDGVVLFDTHRTFKAGEGLTVAVSWPKGIIQGPSIGQKIIWFFLDIYNLVAICLFLIVLVWLLMKIRIYRKNKLGTIIPRFYPPSFYPPKGMSPGEIHAFLHYGYNSKSFAADIVNWAVHGLLTISYDNRRYQLMRQNRPEHDGLDASEINIAENNLFARGERVIFNGTYNASVESALKAMKLKSNLLLNGYYDNNITESIICMTVTVLCSLITGFVLLSYYAEQELLFIVLIIYWLITFGLWHYLRGYNAQGKIIKEEIEGFKLFLQTTEEERLKEIGTPPTKTPELYEKYLPYAMALGVEKQWTKKFAPVFEQREKETGVSYIPVWYRGPLRGHYYMTPQFTSNLRNSLSNVVSSASTAPGSSSGFGGGSGGRGGSAGGGGGGGGGGGW